MSDKRPLIVTGLVLLLIIALIGGVIFYLINFIKSRQTPEATQDLFPKSSTNIVIATPGPTNLPAATNAPIAQQPTTGITSDTNSKTVAGQGFQLVVPKNWGVLTCSNSKNFELDPFNATDQTVVCGKAVKPVTVLVGVNSCAGGQVVTLGNLQVRKIVDNNFVTRDGRGTGYHWCTQTSPSLDVTHRVGSGTAFSQDNFSNEVEQIISTLTPASGS